MKLFFRPRVFALTDTYDVYNENSQVEYQVRSDSFTAGHEMRIFDRNNTQVGHISEKLVTLLRRYELYVYGRYISDIRREFSLFHPRFKVDGLGWRVQGNFEDWDYQILEGNSPVATISKLPFHLGDACVIDIASPQDVLPVLLVVIAVDVSEHYQD